MDRYFIVIIASISDVTVFNYLNSQISTFVGHTLLIPQPSPLKNPGWTLLLNLLRNPSFDHTHLNSRPIFMYYFKT